VADVSKRFRLYHDRNQSLKAAAMRGRRARDVALGEHSMQHQHQVEIHRGNAHG